MSNGPEQITATIGATGAGNTLRELHFQATKNAIVTSRGQSGAAGFVVVLPPGQTQETFTVQRSPAGQSMLAPLVVVDGCGQWHTFVGAGTGQ